MNEDHDEVLKRHGVSKPGLTNQKKTIEEMAKALLRQEAEIESLRIYAKSLKGQLDESKSKLAEVTRDDYGGLEKIIEKNEEDGKRYIIGLTAKNDLDFYLSSESPLYIEKVAELAYLKEDFDELKQENEALVKDNEKKKKERDRAFSRAVSAEKKLENFEAIKDLYIGGDCENSPLPFKIEAEDRIVAEVRPGHGKIMICKNKNSSWFFRFGDVYIDGEALSQTKTKGVEIREGDHFKVMWTTEHEMHEECYYLGKK